MSKKTTLLLAPALAPLTGTDSLACAVRDLARALQSTGWQVTIAIGIDNQCDTSRVGLARRLEPLVLQGKEFSVHEGSIESGDIQLLAVSDDTRPAPAQVLEAALSLIDKPEVLQVWSATRSALSVVEAQEHPPVRIVHFSQAGTTTGAIRAQLEKVDHLILASRTDADLERKKKNSHWGELTVKLRGLAPGVDHREWNPARDSLLSQRMTPPNVESKSHAKKALRKELGLEDKDLPLIGILSKIPSFSKPVMDELLAMPVQWAGESAGISLETMAARSPKRASCPRLVSDYERKQMRHRIVAAADFIFMPGAPSPVSQLFPCCYGTAVIAPSRGEFAQRLVNFDPNTHTGSGFLYKEDHEQISAIRRAISSWEQGEKTRSALIERCLGLDLSWETVALRLTELVSTPA